ncbi:uncharacterized protein LOC135487884 [Lineus longissimus]|uniref:uncharacterized protein LOC135487884 n=1 Tax=Lineus longissimus TaxID=88925 RepID=UPI00315C87B0
MAMESSTAIQPKKCKKVRPPPNQTSMAIERQKTHIGASSAQGMAQLQESQSMPPTAQSQVTPFVTMPTGHSETTQVPVASHTPAVVQARKRKKVRQPLSQHCMAIERQKTNIEASSAQGMAQLQEPQSMRSLAQSQVTPFVTMHTGHSETTQVPVASHTPAVVQAKKRKKVRPNQTSMAIERQKTYIGASSSKGTVPLQESQSMPPMAESQVTHSVTMHTGHSETTQVSVASYTPAVLQAKKRTNVKVPPSQNNATLKEQPINVRSSSAQGMAQLPESPSSYEQAQIYVPPIPPKKEAMSKWAEAKVGMPSEGLAVLQPKKYRLHGLINFYLDEIETNGRLCSFTRDAKQSSKAGHQRLLYEDDEMQQKTKNQIKYADLYDVDYFTLQLLLRVRNDLQNINDSGHVFTLLADIVLEDFHRRVSVKGRKIEETTTQDKTASKNQMMTAIGYKPALMRSTSDQIASKLEKQHRIKY